MPETVTASPSARDRLSAPIWAPFLATVPTLVADVRRAIDDISKTPSISRLRIQIVDSFTISLVQAAWVEPIKPDGVRAIATIDYADGPPFPGSSDLLRLLKEELGPDIPVFIY